MRIILADDHPVFRAGMVQMLLSLYPQATIDEAGNAQELNALFAKEEPPKLIVSDLLFPGFDYIRDLKAMRQRFVLCPIVVVSMHNVAEEIDQIMAFGVNGFVSKAIGFNEMLEAIQRVMQGQIEVRISDDVMTSSITSNEKNAALQELTPRQIEILRLLRHGLSNKEMARVLDLSPFTVRSHVSALMKNLGVSNRAAASAIAASFGLE